MPELPEVETVRRGLEPVLVEHRFTKIVINRPNLRYPLPLNLKEMLYDQKVIAVRRRAKYLLVDLENDHTLLWHLGMSGRVLIKKDDLAYTQTIHDHVIFETSNGFRITYHDPRRFGFMLLYSTIELATVSHFKTIGFEPFDDSLDAHTFKEHLNRYSADVKTILLNQKIIVGVGNIYASESLWQAGINPFRKANTLSLDESSKLLHAIRDVLNRAIHAGGSTLRDHRQTDDKPGYFQHLFKVYDRHKQLCPRCISVNLVKVTQNGRSTYYCPSCQT